MFPSIKDLLEHLDISVVISLIALSLSAFSTILSVMNFKIRKRAEEKSAPLIEVTYQDAVKLKSDCTNEDTSDHIWSFHIIITNLSSQKNSIKQANMKFSFVDFSGLTGIFSIPSSMQDTQDLTLPLQLEPYGSVAGWISFSVSDEMYKKMEQISYEVEIIDVNSNNFGFTPIVIIARDSK